MLGIPPDATPTEVHAAWRRQLRYWHPDRGNHPDALEHSKLINQAHDVLSSPSRRADYDRKRSAQGWKPPYTGSGPAGGPTRWVVVQREGPFKSSEGFDHHGFLSRLENLMERGRLIVERRKDAATTGAKWEAQALAMLKDELGDHSYTRAFEAALQEERPAGLANAYGVLWAVYEDARKGDLKPAPRNGKSGSPPRRDRT